MKNDSIENTLGSASLVDCVRGRRTVKGFEERSVDPGELLAAIEAARWAPNHHLTQPWHFYLLGEKAREKTLELNHTITAEGRDPEVARRKTARWAQVPGWVVVTCASAESELAQLEDYAACCCAIHNFSLHLWHRGIGMKWSTGPITRDQRFYDALGIEYEKATIIALVSYGYPKRVPVQRRRPVDEIVTRLD